MVAALGRYELPLLEKQFIERVKDYYELNGMLTEQQESILEGIYREKIRWTKKAMQREGVYTDKGAV